MGYDTKKEVWENGFRLIVCSDLIESRMWSRYALKRKMKH